MARRWLTVFPLPSVAYARGRNNRIHSARVTIVLGKTQWFINFFVVVVVYMWKHTNNLLTCKEEKLRMKLQMKGDLTTLKGSYFSKLLFFDGSGLQKKKITFSLFLIVDFIYSSRTGLWLSLWSDSGFVLFVFFLKTWLWRSQCTRTVKGVFFLILNYGNLLFYA